jgi:hypothetical protein
VLTREPSGSSEIRVERAEEGRREDEYALMMGIDYE